MRICFEKVELGGEDAVFFQNVMNAFLEVDHESECRARLSRNLLIKSFQIRKSSQTSFWH